MKIFINEDLDLLLKKIQEIARFSYYSTKKDRLLSKLNAIDAEIGNLRNLIANMKEGIKIQ